MKFNSQNGVTLVSLVAYIVSFLIIATIIGSVTIFFYNNASMLDTEVYSASEYNKLNMYFVKETEEKNNKVLEISQSDNSLNHIEFSNGDKFTFDKANKLLYYNKICLCEDVQNVKMNTSYDTGKEVINVKVDFTNKSYSNKYTMMQ